MSQATYPWRRFFFANGMGRQWHVAGPMSLSNAQSVRETATEPARVLTNPPQNLAAEKHSVLRPQRFWLLLILAWVLSVAYMATELKRGWVPHDEGSFGQSAERVLNGELPHRDFDEIYTGGLAFLHAFAFREFGVSAATMRYVLFAFFVLWVPAVFYIASRFVNAYAAGALTLLAVAWSVPNYAAAVPSWYNLFFATFGAAALLRFIEDEERRWLFVAGLCGGLSIIVKIIGLYYVAAVILFFVFREQALAMQQPAASARRGRFFGVGIIVSLLGFVALLYRMIHKLPGANGIVNFVIPSCAVAILLVSRELRGIPAPDVTRVKAFWRMIAPFALGIAIPVVIFLIPYVRSGAVHDLIRGVFILPSKRLTFATLPSPPPRVMTELLPIALLLFVAYCVSKRAQVLCGILLGIYLGYVLSTSSGDWMTYRSGWYSIVTSVPWIVAAGAIFLGLRLGSHSLAIIRQQQLLLLLSLLALMTLVQFPFSGGIYFCYAAPVLILAAGALFTSLPRPPHFVLGVLLIFYALFAAWRVTPAFIFNIGVGNAPDIQTEPLQMPRAGGLRVDPVEAAMYDELIQLVQQHAGGEYIYAAPDCPEVYFLSGLKNPTRTLFDFFHDPADRDARILQTIESHHIKVVAFNEEPGFSGGMDDHLEEMLEDRFPFTQQVGHFQVRWRR